MAQLIGRNIVKFILLMIAISIVTFVLVGISPIDPVQANVGQTAYASMSDEQRAQLASYWGANTPLWERYLNWLGALLRGDMGTSLRFNAPVTGSHGCRVDSKRNHWFTYGHCCWYQARYPY